MEQPYPVIEFETDVNLDGTVRIPEHVLSQIPEGRRIVLRLTPGVVASSLRVHGVTEQKIVSIARTQYEQRDRVVQFLRAEGALAGREDFLRRVRSLMEPREPARRG